MSDMEKTMELEVNPYDKLLEEEQDRQTKIVKPAYDVQPVKQEKITPSKPEEPLEIIPVAERAVFNSIYVKEYGKSYEMEIEIEEDLLVPDTEPDMDSILSADAKVDSIEIAVKEGNDSYRGTARGEISVEILYKSADDYEEKVICLKNSIQFKKELKNEFRDISQLDVAADIRKKEYRMINERKYRLKIYLDVNAVEVVNHERKLFEDIKGEQLEFLKESKSILNLAFTKNKENDVNENLPINNDKIRPLKIIKSAFTIAENHRQLAADKLVVNGSIWVRIIYLAEMASQGNLSSSLMLYDGKIDNTGFISLDGGSNISACRINMDADGLKADVNESTDGFKISGTVKTNVDFFNITEKEIVTDFYNRNEEMACDNKEDVVCCGFETKISEQTIRETIDISDEIPKLERIIYEDAYIIEKNISETEIKGKMQLEVIAVTESNGIAAAKKICEFTAVNDVPENGDITGSRIFAREINADILNGNQISVMVQLQTEIDVCKRDSIKLITNPCIIKSGENEKKYPIVLHTAKQGDTMWDIAKHYRVSVGDLVKINKTEDISEGMKIVVAR